MSGNNSYIKSMNGIVSFDSNGTTIEGDKVTSGTLNATDINASGGITTSFMYIDYIDKNVNTYLTFISDVLFDYKLYVSDIWASTGGLITINSNTKFTGASVECNTFTASSTINCGYANLDQINTKSNATLEIIPDTEFDAKLLVDSIWASTISRVNINNDTNIIGSLHTSGRILTNSIESLQGLGATAQPLKIGQADDYTTEIKIGRAEFTAGGHTFAAVPPRTTFYAVVDDDIANKKYVDSVVSGTNILRLTNTFTRTSNTFNNLIKTSKIDSVTLFLLIIF